MFQDEPENEITLTAFRLLTMDLLALFHVMNEGTINVLGRRAGFPLSITY
jgi:phosphatidylinositol-binding clathrin assembly protein